MSDTTDPNISTRTVAEVRQHRNRRVAQTLRQMADRLEEPDVKVITLHHERVLVELQNRPGETMVRRGQQFGGSNDLVIAIAATFIAPHGTECPDNHAGDCRAPDCAYCAWRRCSGCGAIDNGDRRGPNHAVSCPVAATPDDTDPEG